MKKEKVLHFAQGAIIAAMYVALTWFQEIIFPSVIADPICPFGCAKRQKTTHGYPHILGVPAFFILSIDIPRQKCYNIRV